VFYNVTNVQCLAIFDIKLFVVACGRSKAS
jgi:hypothetical protein